MRLNCLLFVILIGQTTGELCRMNNQTEFVHFYRSKSGECLPCLPYCHHRTNVCLHVNQLRHLCSTIYRARNIRECQQKLTPTIVQTFLLQNQTDSYNETETNQDEPICLFCGHATRGLRCESCVPRPNSKQLVHLIESKPPTATCFDCTCSGQNYQCQTNVTEGCLCLSYLLDTNLADLKFLSCLSNRTGADAYQIPCRSRIQNQCQSCKRGYGGVTSERGHRCYKPLPTDKVQCFDYGVSSEHCPNNTEKFRSEDDKTVSLEIAPNYRNLNIRVLVSIKNGHVDLICSVRNANFIVLNDQRVYYEYQSTIEDEPVFREYDLTKEDLNFGILYSNPSDIIVVRNLSKDHRVTILVSPSNIDFTQENLRCVLIDQGTIKNRTADLVDPSFEENEFSLSDYRAIHLSTGSPVLDSKTIGFIIIYQSRMNIDLFVFFSVFFSSFFLFLSVGICFWKVKFAYEIHRRRRNIKHEYHKRMARPFSRIQLLVRPSTVLSDPEEKTEQLMNPLIPGSVDIPLLLPTTRTDTDYSSHVVAVEPLRDENTCYTTLLFHLPGDLSTQYRLCAGTTLTHLPSDYTNALTNAQNEAALLKKNRRKRRRTKRNGHKSKILLKKSNHGNNRQSHVQQQQQQQTTRQRKSNFPQAEQPRTTVGV